MYCMIALLANLQGNIIYFYFLWQNSPQKYNLRFIQNSSTASKSIRGSGSTASKSILGSGSTASKSTCKNIHFQFLEISSAEQHFHYTFCKFKQMSSSLFKSFFSISAGEEGIRVPPPTLSLFLSLTVTYKQTDTLT